MIAPVDVAAFQRLHVGPDGQKLLPDGRIGAKTQWAMAINELPLRSRRVAEVVRMIGPLLTGVGKAIYWGLGAAQTAAELFGATKQLANAAHQGRIPHSPEEARQIKLNAKGPQSPKR